LIEYQEKYIIEEDDELETNNEIDSKDKADKEGVDKNID